MRKYAVDMHLPDGKRPGYYAQVVKSLASVPLYDRDKETLIVRDLDGLAAVKTVMEDYGFAYDELTLLQLPETASLRPAFSDYGFESRSGNRYMLEQLAAVFRFVSVSPEPAGAQAALMQMEEHLLASFELDGQTLYAVDAALLDLIQGIAKASECKIAAVTL